MRHFLLPCVLLVLVLPGPGAWASRGENLLSDGGFDALPGSTQSPWQFSGTGSVQAGGAGYLPSGEHVPSAMLIADGDTTATISQCVPVSLAAGTLLNFSVQAFTDQLSSFADTYDEVAVRTFDSGDCSGAPTLELLRITHSGLAAHRFGRLWYFDPFPPLPSTRSVQVAIHIASTDPAAEYRVSWDQARLTALHDLAGAPVTRRYWHQDIEGVADQIENGDEFGIALAVGDFDHDGYDDLAIGAPAEDRTAFGTDYIDAGLVHVLYGSPIGLGPANSQTLGAIPFQGGLHAFARVGAALAAGDIDRDGFDDLVIGSPGSNDGAASGAGAIYVAMGSAEGLVGFQRISQASSQLGNNSESGDRFGFSLAMGDVNRDGYAEVAVGTPGESVGGSGADTGAVYLLYGGSDGLQGAGAPRAPQVLTQSGLMHGLQPGVQFGYAVALDDVDQDLRDDLVVGVPFTDAGGTNVGMAFVLHSDFNQIDPADNLPLKPFDFGESEPQASFFFGSSLSAGEHAFSLGYRRSLLLGASGANSGGTLGHGRGYRRSQDDNATPQQAQFDIVDQGPAPEAPEAFDQFGWASLFADLDGDGLSNDEVISAPGEDGEAGAVLLTGINVQLPRGLRQSDLGGAHEAGDRFGAALARGNFNGRGADELAIGIPGESVASPSGGAGDAGAVLEIGWDEPLPQLFRNGFEDPQP